MKLDNFFTSGWEFNHDQVDLKSTFQMANIALLASAFAFISGIIINTVNELYHFIPIEVIMLFVNIVLFFTLRRVKNFLNVATTVITIQCTMLIIYIIYTTSIEDMKFIWIFTYPIVLLYFQRGKKGLYWFVFIVIALILSKVQNIVDTNFSIFELFLIILVLLIIAIIVYFYQVKMNEAASLILEQQKMLLDFNANLEQQVKEKTAQLKELNNSLEKKVEEKVKELMKKDELITVQSKQAVMGEMISMIAHQWRQPLSTITLEISNLQLKRLLGEETSCDIVDEKLGQISDTIVYLSDTIDDFQTYFHPQKQSEEIDLDELLKKAINFVLPRVQKTNINIVIKNLEKINIKTYINELIQVVMILLNNAVDAHLERETKDPKIDILVIDNKQRVSISVKDNAGGISSKNLPHIFEPYFSTKAKNGTGLGLYMSQMIIQKQFHGEVKVQSVKNGAVFTIDILKQIN
jgi:C4-dicarboxylate-specific signal transduction histidine kinase